MKYRIAFKNLPFVPVKEQVIYVENLFDEKTNRFIKDNYHALVNEFNMYGLEFVYLPLYFDSAELEKKVRYYAPYLVSRINDEVTLRSSYILDYMVRPENRPQIPPSLFFAPKKEFGAWIFSALSIDDVIDDGNTVADFVELAIGSVLKAELQIEYRIAETNGATCCSLDIAEEPSESSETKTRFRKVESNYDGGGIRFRKVDPEKEKREKQSRKAKKISFDSSFNLFSEFIKKCIGETEEKPFLDDNAEKSLDEKEGEVRFHRVMDETEESFMRGELEIKEILNNIQTNVGKLRLMGVALGAIHEFIDKLEPLSPLVITEDLRLFLPLYNNIEIELSAQRKALYFLFLNHPEGIVLQHLEEYHNELLNYYKQTNNGVLTPKMEESIKKLEEYGNNQLNVLITRIREAFCLKFDERLARNYFISGERGEAYRIPLNRDLVKWEE